VGCGFTVGWDDDVQLGGMGHIIYDSHMLIDINCSKKMQLTSKSVLTQPEIYEIFLCSCVFHVRLVSSHVSVLSSLVSLHQTLSPPRHHRSQVMQMSFIAEHGITTECSLSIIVKVSKSEILVYIFCTICRMWSILNMCRVEYVQWLADSFSMCMSLLL